MPAAPRPQPDKARRTRSATLAACALAALTLASCGIDRLTGFGESGSLEPAAAEGIRATPPVELAGRWTLTSPDAETCALTLGAVAGATEGTIAPADGCPYTFFTARKWTYEDRGLVLRDHTGQTLVALSLAAPDRFQGQTTGGHAISLAR
ncbi:MAG: hypothetical protein EPO23_00965 [Xanthobacteraceae bacterium]|nr:MAG: hypothetical protein EPO23_00965 [Xanthobacteraceae bacterium]